MENIIRLNDFVGSYLQQYGIEYVIANFESIRDAYYSQKEQNKSN